MVVYFVFFITCYGNVLVVLFLYNKLIVRLYFVLESIVHVYTLYIIIIYSLFAHIDTSIDSTTISTS